jgi:hypothetical protein
MPRPAGAFDSGSIGVRECHERVAPARCLSALSTGTLAPSPHSESLWYLLDCGTIWGYGVHPSMGGVRSLSVAKSGADGRRASGDTESRRRRFRLRIYSAGRWDTGPQRCRRIISDPIACTHRRPSARPSQTPPPATAPRPTTPPATHTMLAQPAFASTREQHQLPPMHAAYR